MAQICAIVQWQKPKLCGETLAQMLVKQNEPLQFEINYAFTQI